MFRKLALAAVAAAPWVPRAGADAGRRPGGTAATRAASSAGWGPRFYLGAPVSYGYGGCYVRQLVPTPWGPRWRLVNRCY